MFKPVNTDRISQSIIDQIKEAIFQKKLRVGDKLPSERMLMEQFGTSRVTIREALRALEYSGIIEVTRGVEGGAFVRDPHTKFVSNFLQDMFSMGNIRLSHLTEARLAIEPSSARLACERMKEDSLEAMRQNIVETKKFLKKKEYVEVRLFNLEFHRLVALASENPVILFMMNSIMDIMEKNVASILISYETQEDTVRFHEKLYAAMKEGDAKKAQDLMLKDIQYIQKALETSNKEPEAL
jgi:GntR family transcriptional regulator, transcriptional repressor for pyruvate dehydrogenase complex